MNVKIEPPDWKPEASLGFWVKRVTQTMVKLQDQRLRAWGLSVSQLAILHVLDEAGELSQRALADAVGVEQPTMANALARLERLGVVQRRRDPKDGRGSLTSLTDAARASAFAAKQALVDVEAQAVAGISEDDKQTALAVLKRVLDNLER